MLRRYSKVRAAAGASIQNDISQSVKPPSTEIYEKHALDLSRAVEESQKNADRVIYVAKIILYMSSNLHCTVP